MIYVVLLLSVENPMITFGFKLDAEVSDSPELDRLRATSLYLLQLASPRPPASRPVAAAAAKRAAAASERSEEVAMAGQFDSEHGWKFEGLTRGLVT